MAADDDPWGDGAVDRGQVSGKEVQLLICGTEWASIETCRAAWF